MKLFHVLSLCAVLGLCAACSNEDSTTLSQAELKVVADIAPTTRTPNFNEDGSGQFVNGDQNTLFFHTAGNQLLQRFDYTYGNHYFWNEVKLPEGTQTCRLAACYPAVSTTTPESFSWNVMTASTPDFLAAKPVDVNVNSSAAIHLSFAHLMHKLRVEVTSTDPAITESMLNAASVKVRNFQPVAQLNLLQAKATGASGNLSELQGKGKNTHFILPGQPVGSMVVEVKVGSKTGTFRLSEVSVNGANLQQLESGKVFTLKVKATPTQNDLVINGQNIAGWEDQGGFDDTIII